MSCLNILHILWDSGCAEGLLSKAIKFRASVLQHLGLLLVADN